MAKDIWSGVPSLKRAKSASCGNKMIYAVGEIPFADSIERD